MYVFRPCSNRPSFGSTSVSRVVVMAVVVLAAWLGVSYDTRSLPGRCFVTRVTRVSRTPSATLSTIITLRGCAHRCRLAVPLAVGR